MAHLLLIAEDIICAGINRSIVPKRTASPKPRSTRTEECKERGASAEILRGRIVKDHLFVGAGMVAGHDGPCRFPGAEVDRLVRHAGRNEEKVPLAVGDLPAQPLAIAGLDTPFQNVDRGFEAAMIVGFGRAAGGMTTRLMESPRAPEVSSETPKK